MFRLESPGYWVFEKILPEKVCDAITEIGESVLPQIGQIGDPDNSDTNTEFRNSSISWIDPTSWVAGLCAHFFNAANVNSKWNIALDYTESPQFTEYQQGQFYAFHTDSQVARKKDGLQRKLSLSIQLTEKTEYEGGVLRFKNFGEEEIYTEPAFEHKGSVIVFPSHVQHEVTKITKGTRKALVTWCHGPEWR